MCSLRRAGRKLVVLVSRSGHATICPNRNRLLLHVQWDPCWSLCRAVSELLYWLREQWQRCTPPPRRSSDLSGSPLAQRREPVESCIAVLFGLVPEPWRRERRRSCVLLLNGIVVIWLNCGTRLTHGDGWLSRLSRGSAECVLMPHTPHWRRGNRSWQRAFSTRLVAP